LKRESIFSKQTSYNGLYKNKKAFDIDFYYFAPILLLYQQGETSVNEEDAASL
jgi:hypothetical protein